MRKRGFAARQEQEQRQQGQPEGAALAAAAAVKRRVVKIHKKDKNYLECDSTWPGKKNLDDNVSCLCLLFWCLSSKMIFAIKFYCPEMET